MPPHAAGFHANGIESVTIFPIQLIKITRISSWGSFLKKKKSGDRSIRSRHPASFDLMITIRDFLLPNNLRCPQTMALGYPRFTGRLGLRAPDASVHACASSCGAGGSSYKDATRPEGKLGRERAVCTAPCRAVPCLPRASLLVIARALWYDPRTRVSSSRRATGRTSRRIDPLIAGRPGGQGRNGDERGRGWRSPCPPARVEDAPGYIYQEGSHLRPRAHPRCFLFPRSTNRSTKPGAPSRRESTRTTLADRHCIVDFVTRSLHGASALRSRDREVSRLSMLLPWKVAAPPVHRPTYRTDRQALLGLEISAEIVSFPNN